VRTGPRPSPDLAWLAHPAITGLAPEAWAELIDRLLVLHHGQRETKLDKRRGQRPRIKGDGTTGRRPILTLPDRLLAVVLHQRLALPQVAIADLFGVAAETVNRRLRDLRQLLEEDGTTIRPVRTRLRTLEDLHRYTDRKGITRHTEIKPAC
jgi:hypothetical protein